MALITSLGTTFALNEASGSRLSTPSGITLTDNNTVTSAVGVGGVGVAAEFTRANSEYLSCASNPLLVTGAGGWTIGIWVMLYSKPGPMTFVLKGTSVFEYALAYVSTDDLFECTFVLSGGFPTVDYTPLGSPALNTWYRILFWNDAVANQIGMSINAGTPVTLSHSGGTNSTTEVFRLGSDLNTDYLNGRLQGFTQWSKTLTSAERTQDYNGGAYLSYADISRLGIGRPVGVNQSVKRASLY